MTVIVGVSDGTRVCVACDSQVTDNGHKSQMAESKIIRRGPLLMGCDGAWGFWDILRWGAGLRFAHGRGDPADLQTSLDEYLAAEFVPWLRDESAKRKLEDNSDSRCRMIGTTLVAHKSQVRVIGRDGCIANFARGWAVAGSGRCEASGAVWAMQSVEHWSAEVVARAAVAAAIEMDDGCSGPIRHEWTDP